MKHRILLILVSLLSFSLSLSAQMSDSQVVEYIRKGYTQGSDQNQIGMDLIKRGVTKEQLERVKKNLENQNNNNLPNLLENNSRQNAREVKSSELLSQWDFEPNLDSIYGDTIKIFGQDIFSKKDLSFAPNLNIPTPPNYKLAGGDEVIIDIWGASQAEFRKEISPNGTIIIENLSPIYLNGLTIDQAEKTLKSKLSEIYAGIDEENGNSSLKLSLGNIRTISVNVIGEVIAPGTYTLTSLSSVFNALYMAGGISKIGSLREINVFRYGQKIMTLDVYDYLLHGKIPNDITLQEGDVIIVPAYKILVQTWGKIKRPMYYELKDNETLDQLIFYSGGFTGDAYRDNVTVQRKSGSYDYIYSVESNDFNTFSLQDTDVVSVEGGYNIFANKVTIQGSVFRPGDYEIGKNNRTVLDLIRSAGGTKEDAYLGRAILTRQKNDLTQTLLPLNISEIYAGKMPDIALANNDTITIASKNVKDTFGPLTISGFVENPGDYPYAENASIKDLIIIAGGLTSAASTSKVDVSRRIIDPSTNQSSNKMIETFTFSIEDGLEALDKETFTLEPYDIIYVRKSPSYFDQRNVVVEGEVVFPGEYALSSKNERLSEVIKNSGGLTNSAYIKGAKLLRELSIKEQIEQREKLKRINQSLKSDTITMEEEIKESIFMPIGINLELAMKNPGSPHDVVLKAGDKIVVPEHNSTVRIIGAVMNPNTVTYEPNKSIDYYISQAGGYSERAQKSKGYIVHMNGQVSKLKGKNIIQPGSEIVIPLKEDKKGMSTGERIAIASSVVSMVSVVALLINALK